MTILSDIELLFLISNKQMVIEPFLKGRLAPAGYDFSSGVACDLPPMQQTLIVTAEHLEVPADVLGTIYLKSSLCREGLIGGFAVIDPGFRGKLTLSLFNAGDSIVRIDKNEPLIQVVFHKTGAPSSNPYNGRYQDSSGIVESKRKAPKPKKIRSLPSTKTRHAGKLLI
jgi:dCTP deaminase